MHMRIGRQDVVSVLATIYSNSAASIEEAQGQIKVFGKFWLRDKARAVDEIDFEVRPNEIFGLLGHNGSGKSTTIKMLLGLIRKSKGISLEVSDHSSVGEPVFFTVDLLSERVAGFSLAVSGSFSPDFLSERVVSCLDDFGFSSSVDPPPPLWVMLVLSVLFLFLAKNGGA